MRDPLLPHAYVKGVCVAGRMGVERLYVRTAISRLCQDDGLKGVFRTKGMVPPSTEHGTKDLAAWPRHCYLSKLVGEGGRAWGGGGGMQERARPPTSFMYRPRVVYSQPVHFSHFGRKCTALGFFYSEPAHIGHLGQKCTS